MKCESVRAQLTAYLDGELSDDRGSAVRGHLRGCEACRGVAADEAALRDGLRALPPLDPPPSLWANVQARLAQEEVADAERPAWRRVLARWAPRLPHVGLATGALAAAVVLVVVKLQGPGAPTDPAPAVDDVGPVAVTPGRALPPAPRPDPAEQDDVTADVATEPSRVTESYAETARELLEIAGEVRRGWSAERKREFDAQLSALQGKIAAAKDDRRRQAAYRAMIRFLQRASIHDDVALASIGGAR